MARKRNDGDQDGSLDKYAALVSKLSPDTLRILARDTSDAELTLAAAQKLRRIERRAPAQMRCNADRVEAVEPSFAWFVHSHGVQDEDVATQVGDVICDALHLCKSRGGDPFQALRQGVGNFAAECIDQDGLGPDMLVEVRLNGRKPSLALEEARSLYAELTGTTPASSPPSE